MPIMPGLIIASGVASAGMQVAGGMAASTEAKYNAKIKEQQAGMIESQKGLEAYQADRQIGKASSTLTARVAKSGLMMSGSPMAALIDMNTQMELDKSIGQYNLDIQKNYALSEASAYKRQSKTALTQGITGAFSSMLQTGAYYGMSKMQYPTGTATALRAK